MKLKYKLCVINRLYCNWRYAWIFFFATSVSKENTVEMHRLIRRFNKDEQGISRISRSTYLPSVQSPAPRNLSILLLYFLSITNKMQRYTILFITVNVLHVSGDFSARHQELKNCTHSIGYSSSSTYTGYCVYSFWAPDDGRRSRLKHVQHWQ
jgi:hypothetical protein